MFVAELMTRNPRTVVESDPVSLARTLLREGDFHQLPVMDESNRLVGIISDRDVRSAIGFDRKLDDELYVSEVMTANPTTIPLGATLDRALGVLCVGSFNALPVMEKNHVVGIITRRDVLEAFRKVLGLDRDGSRLEIALPNLCDDLSQAFSALKACQCDVTSAVVSSMRADGDEPMLYLRVVAGRAGAVERTMRAAGLIVLVPEHR